MKQINFSNFFSKIFKGNQGEAEVLSSISKLLRNKEGEENYYLIPKSTLSDINGSVEIDIILLHPTLGIFVIEVKNWDNIENINSLNNPFEQANRYQDMLLSLLGHEFGKVPMNVEYRVVFPRVSIEAGDAYFKEHKSYMGYKNHTFFKEHLEDKKIFERFFNASNCVIPNKKEFLKIASMLVPTDKLKDNQSKIIPVITKDEILFFDQKQLSIMNGYTGGFRIVRGVAGTGKTVILTNFVASRLSNDSTEKFLILCFNNKLKENLVEIFGDGYSSKNIAIYSIFGLLKRLDFDFEKVGLHNDSKFEDMYKLFESDIALEEFRTKLKARLKTNPIDYFLCDETQDMPAGFMRILYEEIHDCILFIDEAQRYFSYTMNSVADIFHHPKFEKLNMAGRVKHLKNVYRTPSNIAKCAFEILSNDNSLNDYYKKSYYLQNDFLHDVNFILEDGDINIGDYDDFEVLKSLIKKLPEDEDSVVLGYTKKTVDIIQNIVDEIGASNRVRVMTLQSIKGLEAQNVIIHNFGYFLEKESSRDVDIFLRKIYVLLTRAQESIYLSIGNQAELLKIDKTKVVLEILKKYSENKSYDTKYIDKEKPEIKEIKKPRLAKLKPAMKEFKEGAEIVVVASELFMLIATGFFV